MGGRETSRLAQKTLLDVVTDGSPNSSREGKKEKLGIGIRVWRWLVVAPGGVSSGFACGRFDLGRGGQRGE